ncbi:nitrous oxide reductase family maturation protein NosD [Streptomyces sp. NPDC007264]|uniref:right-handed parallel beta-helix repeat-containing protein n=1 Tax=Streptomyces sp. NPDC007264 TaxID=3364777 RepID=UPI0036DF6DA9
MTKHHIAPVVCAAVLTGTALGAAPPATAPTTRLLHPGDSVQEAVDAAEPGDTILLSPGTYRGSVRVTTSRLTLRGTGPGTVIAPAPAPAPAAAATDACARAGNGICVEGTDGQPVRDTTIASLTVSGFAKNGLWSSRTDRLTVHGVTAEKNRQWGIALERATRGAIVDDTVRENGDAGVMLVNTLDTETGATDTGGTVIARNRMQGNRVGASVRRVRNVTVASNDITGNCVGMFVVGDENAPPTGAVTVSGNIVHENNRFCPKTARLPFRQGSGIVLTGVVDTLVVRNVVSGNTGTSPFSGGVVLFKSMVGVPNDRNRISNNTLRGNGPADLVDRDTGKANAFHGNSCQASRPAGLC